MPRRAFFPGLSIISATMCCVGIGITNAITLSWDEGATAPDSCSLGLSPVPQVSVALASVVQPPQVFNAMSEVMLHAAVPRD